VGVGARRSAAKSTSVTSVSWPTPAITGIGIAATARTTRSSLKAHKSSIEPPPRATISTSTSQRAAACASADTSAGGASAPCTGDGYTTTHTWGARRASVLSTSCNAAPAVDVTMPTARAKRGNGRLRALSNNPSASSLAFSRRNCSCSEPAPSARIDSTMNCISPRGS
jgi:hypothetical protein